jgi:hypothetical protein
VTGELAAGLQAERTVLAHWRTALATVVVALLMVRQSATGAERVAAVILAAMAVVVVSAAMIRRQRGLVAGHVTASRGTVVAVTTSVVALQLGAVIVVL